MAPTATKLIASNRRARHDYSILDVVEAGIVLTGSEVKSLRLGQVQLADAYARFHNGEIWMEGVHMAPYQFAVGVGPTSPIDPASCSSTRARSPAEGARRPGTRRARPTLAVLQGGPGQGRARRRQGPHQGRQAQAMAERDSNREIERALGRTRKGVN